MKRMDGNTVGVESGETLLFSDFEDGGDMWSGTGERERRQRIIFSTPFKSPPTVQASLALWDVDAATVMRGDLISENIAEEGFDLVFKTWGDTRFARARVAWLAIGPLPREDDWDLY
ncbi:H-type lectin domain-containing protein [Sulfitobacter marinus]|uniref:H-type lectin domain-containing protein n=2 Tax=Sulfitobacter marinus TaxID=394264 RepID=A0A1I6RJQ0_9RHOB|nr:H-type lectin domain-containing protein [Sulfitobacter marinus]